MTKIEKAIMKEILKKLDAPPENTRSWSQQSARYKGSVLNEKSVKEGIQMLKDTLADPYKVYNSLDIVPKK